MPLTHKQKVKMARRMRTHKELVDRVSIFDTKAWRIRKVAIRERLHPTDRIFIPTPIATPVKKLTLWQRIKRFFGI